MTDRGDRLAGRDECLDEGDRVAVDAQRIRVHGPTREQKRVVVVHGGIGDQPVNRQGASRNHVELASLDLTGMDREQVAGRTRAVKRTARLFQFDRLDPPSAARIAIFLPWSSLAM